jgi:hypothetical protein
MHVSKAGSVSIFRERERSPAVLEHVKKNNSMMSMLLLQLLSIAEKGSNI